MPRAVSVCAPVHLVQGDDGCATGYAAHRPRGKGQRGMGWPVIIPAADVKTGAVISGRVCYQVGNRRVPENRQGHLQVGG